MVARAQRGSFTLEEAASFLNRAPWFVAGAIERGELMSDAAGRLSRAALLTFIEEEAQRDAALRAVLAESEGAGLDAPGTYERLVSLGIVEAEEGGDCDR